MIEARIPLSFATLTFNAGTVLNLDSSRDEIGLQMTASALRSLGRGFSTITGVLYRTELGTDSLGAAFVGTSLLYSF
jgi:hypothetical protein